MLYNVYIVLEILAIFALILSLIPFNNRKQWMPAAFAVMIFFYLALSSAQIVIPSNELSSANESIELVEHSADYSCSGDPHDCDYYDLNEPDCLAAGCLYNDTLCSGTPTECSLLDPVTCLIAGCSYERGQSTFQNETVIRSYYNCNYCSYKDIPQMWFNSGMAFLSLIVAASLMIMKRGNDY